VRATPRRAACWRRRPQTSLRANALTMWREALKIDEGEGDRSQVAFNAGELLLENGELAECIKMYKVKHNTSVILFT
jgi:hypothetical protein